MERSPFTDSAVFTTDSGSYRHGLVRRFDGLLAKRIAPGKRLPTPRFCSTSRENT